MGCLIQMVLCHIWIKRLVDCFFTLCLSLQSSLYIFVLFFGFSMFALNNTDSESCIDFQRLIEVRHPSKFFLRLIRLRKLLIKLFAQLVEIPRWFENWVYLLSDLLLIFYIFSFPPLSTFKLGCFYIFLCTTRSKLLHHWFTFYSAIVDEIK